VRKKRNGGKGEKNKKSATRSVASENRQRAGWEVQKKTAKDQAGKKPSTDESVRGGN